MCVCVCFFFGGEGVGVIGLQRLFGVFGWFLLGL